MKYHHHISRADLRVRPADDEIAEAIASDLSADEPADTDLSRLLHPKPTVSNEEEGYDKPKTKPKVSRKPKSKTSEGDVS